MFGLLRRSRRLRLQPDESGATAVEYALVVGLVGIGIITAVTTLAGRAKDTFTFVGGTLYGITAPQRAAAGSTVRVGFRNPGNNHYYFSVMPKGGGNCGYASRDTGTAGLVWLNGVTGNWASNASANENSYIDLPIGGAGEKEIGLWDADVQVGGCNTLLASVPVRVL